MPEYLAPGVFMEEVSYRSKSIEGVSTTTTGFVGPARFGPTSGVPQLTTSLAEFEATFGDGKPLSFAPNYLWLGVRAFFENGGKRLYISRVVADAAVKASKTVGSVTFSARHDGEFGNVVVSITLVAGPDLVSDRKVVGLRAHDVLLYDDGDDAALRQVEALPSGELRIASAGGGNAAIALDAVPANKPVRRITANLDVISGGRSIFSAAGLALDKRSAGASLERCLDPAATGLSPVTTDAGWADIVVALKAATATPGDTTIEQLNANTDGTGVLATLTLENGTDGPEPDDAKYEGADGDAPTGLAALEHVPEISIVAAPAVAWDSANHEAVISALISHAKSMRYRIAVLDAADSSVVDVRALRAGFDASHAALYYPWVSVADPNGPGEIAVPPSGFVAGVYARNDIERGVWKAPANEVVLGALGFSKPINTARQEVLNPLGINCLRSFEGRGHRVWGARTISSDPEWKYVNLRRYFNYLERSIDISTQWAVFEPNGERLWGNVRRTIADFLFNEFQMGALLGDKPEAAYFVKCDRSTMTQNDLDNGRLVCQVGVAALRPAEFVIFRIGQWTGDRRG